MTLAVDIDAALLDPNLLGAGLGDAVSWAAWMSVLKAANGIPLSGVERRTFGTLAGGRKPPASRVRELWCSAGRRSGKSKMASAIAVYEALLRDNRGRLSPGERGFVLLLAASRSQAAVLFSYCLAYIESSPLLRQQIESTTQDEIRLRGGVTIAVHPNSHRTIRGRTLLCCICDEISFWRDESSSTPDIEAVRAILPALSTSQGQLIGISSPYQKRGVLFSRHRDHYGRDSDVLVIQASTAALNPVLDRAVIDNAMRDDPIAAMSEWQGEFRNDLSAFLSDELIDAAIDPDRPLEIEPRAGLSYTAFCDPSGGRGDAFGLCIGHSENGRFIADVVRGRTSPFSPPVVVQEYSQLAREYRCRCIHGDNYSAEWVAQSFRDAGLQYKRAELAKSPIYLECLPIFTRGGISIPNHSALIRELRLLERRTGAGRDRVDHPSHCNDDHANAVLGCAWLAMRKPKFQRLGVGSINVGEARAVRPAGAGIYF